MLLLAQAATAQRTSGVVRESGSGAPVAGAVVFAVDSAGRSMARTITDEKGRFALAWQPNAVQLRSVRIGYRPAMTSPRRGSTTDTTIDFVMERVPVQLDAVRVSSDPICGGSPNARAALELWEQARLALLATIVAREAKPAQVSNLTFERQVGKDGRVSLQRTLLTKGTSKRPFAARPAALLAAQGYRVGSLVQQMYYAPDADVLFDESFAGAHCFGVDVNAREHPGLVGLTFVPRDRGDRDSTVDVRGVLWVDSKGPTLVLLDFRYTGVGGAAARANAGGTVHFQSMPNGITFIDDWAISLPMLSNVANRKFGGDTVLTSVLTGLSESGGFVVDALWPDSLHWTTRSAASVRGRVVEHGTNGGAQGVVVGIAGMRTTVTDSMGRFSFELLPQGRYGLEISDTTFGAFLRERTASREVIVSRGDTVPLNLEVPSRTSLVEALCKGQRQETAVILGRISDGSDAWPKKLEVESSWLADVAIPAAGSGVGIVQGKAMIDVDDAGRFHVCGVARDRPILLRALIGRVSLADTAVRATAAVRTVQWTTRKGLFSNALLGDGSAFAGRVVREGDGAPVADAEIWLFPAEERARTDSTGRFHLFGLRSGQQVVQIRRIGFAARRDTVMLRAHEETTRQFSLAAQAAELDTVHTRAGYVRYVSPALQGFEARRATGMGHYISEADLRKNDNGSLASVLVSRIPGTMLLSYGTSSFLAAPRGMRLSNAIALDPASPRACWVSLYVDGVQIYRGPPEDAPDMTRLRVDSYAGVEFYSGAASVPSQFNSARDNVCGVLLLWTRER